MSNLLDQCRRCVKQMFNFSNSLYYKCGRYTIVDIFGLKFLIKTKQKIKDIVFSPYKYEEFEKYKKLPDYQQIYDRLISNLDKDSVETIDLILDKVENVIYLRKDKSIKIQDYDYDFFTKNDAWENYKNFKNLNQKIKANKDGFYTWNNYTLPVNKFELCVFLHKHCLDYVDNLDKIRSKDIIDVGAYIGDSALLLSEYTDKKVYSLEPSTPNYNNLLKTIELNNLKNVVPIKCGIGDKNEEIEINNVLGSCPCDANRITGAEIFSDLETMSKEYIKIRTLDDIVKENDIEVGLIKVDTEGFEKQFIQGALETLKSQRPTMLMSIYHSADDFYTIKTYLESLNLGYSFKVVKLFDKSILFDTILICEVK